MIFGISLRKFEMLRDKNFENLDRVSRWQFARTSKRPFKTKKIKDLTFSEFVDCENYLESEQFYEFCAIFVKKFFWQTVYIHDLEPIVKEYSNQKMELIEDNDFIFNPPQYGEPAKETIGSELRKEFVDRFGNYVVLMDMVCKGDFTRYKQVEQWKVSEFFFWANYLTGQKIVEKIK